MSDENPYAAPIYVHKEEVYVDPNPVPQGTVKELINWVSNNVDNAKKALEVELNNSNRKSAIKALEEIINE